MSVWLITLFVGAAAVAGTFFAVQQWRRERFARILDQGARIQLAADGRMALTSVEQRDPEFNEEQFLERAAEFQERFYHAWTAQELRTVSGVMLPGMRTRIELETEMNRALLRKPEVYDIAIQEAKVVEAVQDGWYDTVYVRLSGDAMRRTMHAGTNRWLSGGVSPEPFEEVWGFVRRSDVASRNDAPGTLEGFCPACGEDLQNHAATTRCPACGTVLDDGSRDWAVAFAGPAESWRPSDRPPPEVQAPSDALSQVLDRATEGFWRMRSATLHADEKRLGECATPAFIAENIGRFRASRDQRRSFAALATLGRMECLEFSDARVWIRMHWRGILVQTRVPSFVQEDPARRAPVVEDYVLERPGAQGAWRVAGIFRVQGDVPCSELLDELEETRRLERLPMTTLDDREALLQTFVVLLLRTGPVTGRRMARLKAAAEVFGISQDRLPLLLRQVEAEGAVLFGQECKLPPSLLLRHLARLSISCGAMRPCVLQVLRDVATAMDVPKECSPIVENECRLLMDVVSRIERTGRRV